MHSTPSSPWLASSRRIRSGSLPVMNSEGPGAKAMRQSPLVGAGPSASVLALVAGVAASPASSASSPARASASAGASMAPPCSQAASRLRSTSTDPSSTPMATGSSVRRPARASSSRVSSRWVRSVTLEKPNVAAPPLIEWAARKMTLMVSASPPPDSSDSRPPSIASRPSRLSSKNAAWKRVMSMASAQDLAHGGEQLLGIEGLDQPAGRAGGLAFHLLVATRFGGEHQQRGKAVVGQLAQLADQRDAVHARHVDVGHHRVERTRARDLQRGLAVLGLADLEAARRQGEGHHLAHRGRVVDDEQLLGAHAEAPVLMWVSAVCTADGSASASSTPRLTASASWRAAAASVGEAWVM